MVDNLPLVDLIHGMRACGQCSKALDPKTLGEDYHYVKWHNSSTWFPSCVKCQGVVHDELTLELHIFTWKKG